MPTVTFLPSGKQKNVTAGTTLYRAAVAAGLPVAASCSEEFVCGKCNMRVLSGADQLSPQTRPERELLARESRPTTDRVSCHTVVYGDCTVTTPYW
jgi:ferredoxin